jgi:hypothetical protein
MAISDNDKSFYCEKGNDGWILSSENSINHFDKRRYD